MLTRTTHQLVTYTLFTLIVGGAGIHTGSAKAVVVRELELVAEVPPTGGITVEWIEAIQGLDSSPNEIVFTSRNVGAGCGGGTPVSAWKLILDPDTGEMVELSLKQHLGMIQCVRDTLFEASDGTLFTGGGWCLHKPPYFSTDGGETWQPATQGVHPPNSTFSLGEFNAEVYAGTGYDPWPGQLYHWLGEGGPNHWELVLDIGPRRWIQALIEYDGRFFVGMIIHICSGCESNIPVLVSTDGSSFEPTTGIPPCHSVRDFAVVGGELVAWTQDCGTNDCYVYHWNANLSIWQLVNAIPLGPPAGRMVSHENTVYLLSQATGGVPAGIYRSVDLGQTWEPLALLDSPRARSLHVHERVLYVGTERDANDIAYIYALPLNQPPVCDAGGPYSAECQGATTSIQLDGSGSYDPDPGDTLTYMWISSCPNASFDDSSSATPTLTFTSSGWCTLECTVLLFVTDSQDATTLCCAGVTVTDTTPPEVTCPEDLTVECDGAGNVAERTAWEAGFAASDLCNDVTALPMCSLVPLCGATYIYECNLTAWDECDNAAQCSATFTVVDTTPPAILATASDEIVECDGAGNVDELDAWLASQGGAVASDICSGVTWTDDFAGLSDDCGATGAATVTFTATDDCGNASTTTATFTIEDTTPPEITCPADVTVTCPEPTDPNAVGWAAATDICDDDPAYPAINYLDIKVWSSCLADPVMYTIMRTWIATDECGNSSESVQTITVMKVVLDLDIKPGSCPNSFNRGGHGVLPVALLGTGDFDVTMVDLASVLLSRADCVGGSVAPHEGPPGPHSVWEDVATPFEGEPCDCHELEGDGIVDLLMKFKTDELVPTLELDSLSPGALVALVVSGTLADGCEFIATDCVRLVPPGTPPGQMSVSSNVPGVWLDVSPLDNQLDGGGFADFGRTFPLGTVVTLTASPLHQGSAFAGWKLDGVLQSPGTPSIEVLLSDELTTLRAIYRPWSIQPRAVDELSPLLP